MRLIHTQFDRLKFSVPLQTCDISRIRKLEEGRPRAGRAHGFDWFSFPDFRIGISDAHAVVELLAVWWMRNSVPVSAADDAVDEWLKDVIGCSVDEIRVSRIDIAADWEAPDGINLPEYKGRASVKTSMFASADSVETYAWQPKGRAWILRIYDKSAEIKDNEKEHLYPAYEGRKIWRSEIEVGKEYLQNYSETRSLQSSISAALRLLEDWEGSVPQIMRSDILKTFSSVDKDNVRARGKATGEKLRSQAKGRALEIIQDFLGLGGDINEILTEVCKVKRIIELTDE